MADEKSSLCYGRESDISSAIKAEKIDGADLVIENIPR